MSAARKSRSAPVDLATLRARLDAARAVLDHLGGPGAVDGETRDSRRMALHDAEHDVRSVHKEARGAVRREAATLIAELDKRADAIDPTREGTFLAKRKRKPVVIRTVALILGLMSMIRRSRAPWRDERGADERALAPLYFFLGQWLDTLCNVDDYLAAGFDGQMNQLGHRVVPFRSATKERRVAEEAARVDQETRARRAAEKAEPWVERALREDAALAPAERLARCRIHVNNAHAYTAEASLPFPELGQRDRFGDAADTVVGFLRLCEADLAAAEGVPELAGEVALCRAAVDRVRAAYEMVLAAPGSAL